MSSGPRIRRRQLAAGSQPLTSDLHPVIEKVYRQRGMESAADLDLSLRNLHAANLLKGLDAALARLALALRERQHIMIIGDFDADGATSTALMVLGLRALGAAQVSFLVPNRFEYGYGLTPEIVEKAAEASPDLIITVDNGISSCDGVARADELGVDVVVTDHHLPGHELPAAVAIINPNQLECPFPSKALAGVGVSFYVLAALRTHLEQGGWFEQSGWQAPNMAEFLDIVALGTVADVVPLDRNNRILVRQGVARMRVGRCRPGILALLKVAGRDFRRVKESDLGFAVGPRLNAAGRLTDMSVGIRCLLAEDEAEAMALAVELDNLNRERRQIEQGMQREALAALANIELQALSWSLCLFQADWHQGVIGILAARIRERYNRPCIVFARGDDGHLKGSARSIPGLHIRDALDAVATAHPGLVIKFGGHAMAAGLTLAEARLDEFRDAFEARVRELLSEEDLDGEFVTDGELTDVELDLPLAEAIEGAGPWGQGFPEPVFDGEFELLGQRIVGERHLKLVLGLPGTKRVIDGIQFNADIESWPNPAVKRVRIVYQLDVNEFRNVRSAQMRIDHLEPVS